MAVSLAVLPAAIALRLFDPRAALFGAGLVGAGLLEVKLLAVALGLLRSHVARVGAAHAD
ncbi:MAG: hypothetical protein ABI334_03935 [Candidatus Dormiibacterota bacterium]